MGISMKITAVHPAVDDGNRDWTCVRIDSGEPFFDE
jgi:hypothetical protein